MFIVTYKYWNPAGGATPGIRRFTTRSQLMEWLGLALVDETIIDIHITTPNPMMT